ncbi:TlpA disulfide reductase family protein [Aeromicrobium halocynthiae]|uniref:TlpA family protein disulfide reductase n=1 Tax=Aeromicrobium halocynthiae TaxID=560557 RepID=UPI0031E3A3F2
MRVRRATLGLVAVLALVGCGAEPGGPPTFGGDPADAGVDLADAVQKAQDMGLRECPEPSSATPDGPDALPAVALLCLQDGEPTSLAAIEGPAVVNLWASWCGPCREELPLLARLDEEIGAQVQVVGVDFADRAPEAALELAERSGVTYPQMFDPDQTLRGPLGVVGLPQTVFVDADGRVVATERTPYRSYDDLVAAVDRHLGVRP